MSSQAQVSEVTLILAAAGSEAVLAPPLHANGARPVRPRGPRADQVSACPTDQEIQLSSKRSSSEGSGADPCTFDFIQ